MLGYSDGLSAQLHVLVREAEGAEDRHTGRKPRVDRGSDWSSASPSRGTGRMA